MFVSAPSVKKWLFSVLIAVMPFGAMASDYFQDALTYHSQGDQRSAIIELKNLLQQSPDHPEGRLLLGQTYLETHQYPAAEKELRRAKALGISQNQITPYLAKALIGLQQHEEALQILMNEWQDVKADASERWLLIGQAHLGLKDLTAAENAFQRSIQEQQNDQAQLGLALVAWHQHEADKALARLQPLSDNADVMLQANLLRGDIFLSQSDGSQALIEYERFLQAKPDHLPARLGHARAALMTGEIEVAAKDAALLLDKAPQHPPVRLIAAMTTLLQKDYRSANTHAVMLLQLAPNHVPGLMLAATASYYLDQLQEAESHLLEVLKRIPGHLGATRLMAATLLRQNKAAQALRLLDPMITDGTTDTAILALAGSAHLRTGDWETGEALLSQAMEARPRAAQLVNQVALSRLLNGRGDEALALLDEKTTEANLQSDTLRLMGLVQNGDIRRARDLLETRIAASPGDVNYRLLQALFELRQGNTSAARSAFAAAAQVAPDHPGPQLGMARMDLRENAPEKAKQRFQQVLADHPQHLAALLGMAQAAEMADDTDGVRTWLHKARLQLPEALQPAQLLVRFYLKAGKPEKAVAEAHSFYLGREDQDDAVLLYASTLSLSGSPERAEALLSRLLQHQPDSLKALSMMVELLQQQRRTDEALEYARRLYQAGPHSQRATLAYANLLVQHQDAEQARQVLLPLWERQPSAPAARLLGTLEAQQRNWQAAKNYFAKAYQEQSDPSLLQMILQVEQHIAGDPGVQALLQQHLEHHPEDAYAQLRLAGLYQQLEQTDKAIQHYESVKQLQPDNPIAWNNLAWLYFNIGDQRGLAHAQEAYRLAPQHPEIQDTLGWILLNQGNKQAGLRMLERAVEGLPTTPEVRFHHAAALVENNRSDEARPTLEKLAQEESSVQQQVAALLRQLD